MKLAKSVRLFLTALSITCTTWANAGEYWEDDNRDNMGGRVVSAEMRTFPVMSGTQSLESRIIAGDSIKMSFTVDLQWMNYRRVAATTAFQRTAMIRQISYKYRVGYRSSQNGIVTWFNNGAYVGGDIWVERPDDDPGHTGKLYSYYAKTRNWTFSDNYSADISTFLFDRDYYLVVEFMAKPTDVYDKEENAPSEQNRINLQDDPHYYRWQTLTITEDLSGNKLSFVRKNPDTPDISFNEFNTPRMLVGSRETYVVYNHPDAELSVRLSKNGLLHKKDIGTATYYPVSTLVKGEGTRSPLPSVYSYKELTYQGPVNSWNASATLDRGLNASNPVYYMYDRQKEAEWYCALTGSEMSPYVLPFIRYNGLIEFPKAGGSGYENAMISINHDGRVSADGESLNSDPAYWYEWRLRLGQIADNAGERSVGGREFSLQNANGYYTLQQLNGFLRESYWRIFGYENPTSSQRSKDMLSLSSDETYFPKSNVLQFEVLPAVSIPAPTAEESAVVECCVIPDTAVAAYGPDDVIVVYAKDAETGGYSPSLYGLEYFWEVSYDGANWQSVEDANIAAFRLNQSDLSFNVIANADKDLIMKSSILEGRSRVCIRQACLLNSFSSDQQSSLYNYKKEDGRWYIKISSDGYHTFKPLEVGGLEVLAVDEDGNESEFEDEEICRGDEFFTKSLKWFSDRENGIVEYSVSKLGENGEETELSSGINEFELPETDESVIYRLYANFCNQRIYRDVKFTINELPKIDVKQITSNQIIAKTDSVAGKVEIVSRGGDIEIGFSQIGQGEDYYYRKVVPYTSPELVSTDFSDYGNEQCVGYIVLKAWDFEAESGISFDEASTTQLRAYCSRKQQEENDAIAAAAVNRNVEENAWKEIPDPTALLLEQAGAKYYLRKSDPLTPCMSDSVLVKVDAVSPIINNIIAFSDLEHAGEDTIYVNAGTRIPDIISYTVEGGYGKPVEESAYSYVYQWIFRYDRGVWQDLKRYTDSGRSSVSQSHVSLMNQNDIVDRDMEIARVVISRINAEESTQYCDTSNILRIATETYLDERNVRVVNDGACAGSDISIVINEDFDTGEYRLIYSSDDPRVSIVADEANPSILHLRDTRDSLNVYIARENIQTGAHSNQIVVPVSVVPSHASFTMIADGEEMRILDYGEETFNVRPGTLVQFKDESEGEDLVYAWSLQVQHWLADDIEGDVSNLQNPYCYLYNQGENRIRLKVMARRPDGGYCSSEVTADNIFVQGLPVSRSLPAGTSFIEDNEVVEEIMEEQSAWIEVYPTILTATGRTVHLRSNTDRLEYSLFDGSGRILMHGEFNGMGDLPVPQVPGGVCILEVNGRTFKLLNQ